MQVQITVFKLVYRGLGGQEWQQVVLGEFKQFYFRTKIMHLSYLSQGIALFYQGSAHAQSREM